MSYANLFQEEHLNSAIQRINSLTSETKPLWGKMSVDQMLAHVNVAYVMCYDKSLPRANGLKLFFLRLLIKNQVVGSKPYPKNGRTAPAFIINDSRDFEKEKASLISSLQKTQSLGANHFEGKESVSIGRLTADEWNTLFSKHLDHHLRQFGV